MRVICTSGSLVGRSGCEKYQFCNKMAWDLQNPGEMVLGLGVFNRYNWRRIADFNGLCMDKMELAKKY